MDAKSIAASAAKFDAIKALGRTDDMLAIIGLIMLLGVILSSYGAYWQGTLAKASYKKDFTPQKQDDIEADTKKSTARYILIIGAASIAVVIAIFYIIRKNGKAAEAAVSAVPA